MAAIGVDLEPDDLVLTRNRDFRWTFQNVDQDGIPVNFPAGSLFFEVYNGASTLNWPFSIAGSTATIKVESTVINSVANRSKWQLVFMPSGEVAGGDPIAHGTVRVQG